MRTPAQQQPGTVPRKKRMDSQPAGYAAGAGTGQNAARQQQQQQRNDIASTAFATTVTAGILRLLRLVFVVAVLAILRTHCGLSVGALEGLFPLALLVMVEQSAVGEEGSERLDGVQPSSIATASPHRAATVYAVYAPALEQLMLACAIYLFVDDAVVGQLSVLLLVVNATQWTLGSLVASGITTLVGYAVVYQFDCTAMLVGALMQIESLAPIMSSWHALGEGGRSNGGVYSPPRWLAVLCLTLSIQFFLNANQLLAQTRAYVFQSVVDYLHEAFSTKPTASSTAASNALRWVVRTVDAATYFITPSSVLALVLWYALMMIEWHAHVSIGGTFVSLFTVLALKQARSAPSAHGGEGGANAAALRSVVGAAAAAGSDGKLQHRAKSSHIGFLVFIAVVDGAVYATASPKIVTVLANGTVSALTVLFLWNHSRPSAPARPILPLAVMWVAMVAADLWMHLRGLMLPDQQVDPLGVHTLPVGGILAGVDAPGVLRHCLAVHTSGFGLYLMYCALADSSRAAHIAEEELSILTFLAQPPQPQLQTSPPSDDGDVRSASQAAVTTATSASIEPPTPAVSVAADGGAQAEFNVSAPGSSRGASSDTRDAGASDACSSHPLTEPSDVMCRPENSAKESQDDMPTAAGEDHAPLSSPVVERPTVGGKETSGSSSLAGSVISTVNSTASREPTPVASQAGAPLSKKERAQKRKEEEDRRRAMALKEASLGDHQAAAAASSTTPSAVVAVEARPAPKSVKQEEAQVVAAPSSEASKPKAATTTKPSSAPEAQRKRGPVGPQAVSEPPPPPPAPTTNIKVGSRPLVATDQQPPVKEPLAPQSDGGSHVTPTSSTSGRKTIVLANGKLSFGDVVRGAKQPPPPQQPATSGGSSSNAATSQAPLSVDGALHAAASAAAGGATMPPDAAKVKSASGVQSAGKGPVSACSTGNAPLATRSSIASVDAVDHHSMVPQPKSVQLREKRAAAEAAAATKRGTSGSTPTAALTSPLMKASKAIMSIDGENDGDVSSDDEEWTGRAAVDSPRQLGSTANPVAPPSPLTGFARPPPISPQRGNGNDSKRVTAPQQLRPASHEASSFDAFTGLRLEETSPRNAGGPNATSALPDSSDIASRIIAAAQRSAAAAAESIDIAMFHQALTGRGAGGDDGHTPIDGISKQRDAVEDEADDGATIDVHAVSKIDSMISQLSGNSPLPSEGPPFPGQTVTYTDASASTHGHSNGGGKSYAYPSFITLEELTRSVSAEAPAPRMPGGFTVGGATAVQDDASSLSGASSAHCWAPPPSQGRASGGGGDAQPAPEFDSLLSQGFLHLLDDDNSLPLPPSPSVAQQMPPPQQLSLAASSNHEYNRLMQHVHLAAVGSGAGPMSHTTQQQQQQTYYTPPPPPPPPTAYQVVGNAPSAVVGGSVSQVVMTAQGPYALVLLPNGQQMMCPVVYQQPQQSTQHHIAAVSNSSPAMSPTKMI